MPEKARSWFSIQAKSKKRGEIVIYDEIGMFGITAENFRDELKALGNVDEIEMFINSPGGNVFMGFSIFNLLNRHRANIRVTIDGVAASIASYIAMAADVLVMPENSMMLIHDPFGMVIGTSKELREYAATLDNMKQSMVSAYASKSSLDRDEIEAMMSEETVMTAQEAFDKGFADVIEKPVQIAAHFDLSKFKNASKKLEASDQLENEEITTMAKSAEELKTEAEAKAKADAEAAAKLQADAEAKVKADAEAEAKAKAEAEAKAKADAAKSSSDATARSNTIMSMCKIAGQDAKAVAFIASDKSLDVIAKELVDGQAKGTKEVRSQNAEGDGAAAAVVNTNDIYAKWNGKKAAA